MGRLAFYDASDGKPIGSPQIGFFPHEVIIAKDLKTAYVGNYGFFDHSKKIGVADLSVSCIDISNRAEKFRLYTFDPAEHTDFSQIDKAPHDMQLRPPDEKELYVNAELGNKIIVFDLHSREIIRKIVTLQNIRKMVFSTDGEILWLVSLDAPDSIIAMNAYNGLISGQYKLIKSIQSLAYSPDKRYLLASGENAVALLTLTHFQFIKFLII